MLDLTFGSGRIPRCSHILNAPAISPMCGWSSYAYCLRFMSDSVPALDAVSRSCNVTSRFYIQLLLLFTPEDLIHQRDLQPLGSLGYQRHKPHLYADCPGFLSAHAVKLTTLCPDTNFGMRNLVLCDPSRQYRAPRTLREALFHQACLLMSTNNLSPRTCTHCSQCDKHYLCTML